MRGQRPSTRRAPVALDATALGAPTSITLFPPSYQDLSLPFTENSEAICAQKLPLLAEDVCFCFDTQGLKASCIGKRAALCRSKCFSAARGAAYVCLLIKQCCRRSPLLLRQLPFLAPINTPPARTSSAVRLVLPPKRKQLPAITGTCAQGGQAHLAHLFQYLSVTPALALPSPTASLSPALQQVRNTCSKQAQNMTREHTFDGWLLLEELIHAFSWLKSALVEQEPWMCKHSNTPAARMHSCCTSSCSSMHERGPQASTTEQQQA